MCSSGSCAEQGLVAVGTFSNGDPALACAGAVYVADASQPPDFRCGDGGRLASIAPTVPGGSSLRLSSALPEYTAAEDFSIVSARMTLRGEPVPLETFPARRVDQEHGRLIAQASSVFTEINQNLTFEIELQTATDSTMAVGYASSAFDSSRVKFYAPRSDTPPYCLTIDARAAVNGTSLQPPIIPALDWLIQLNASGVSQAGDYRTVAIETGSVAVEVLVAVIGKIEFGSKSRGQPVPGFSFIQNIGTIKNEYVQCVGTPSSADLEARIRRAVELGTKREYAGLFRLRQSVA